MSKYTTTLKEILASYDMTDEPKASEINTLIDRTRSVLFDFDYPCRNMTADEKEHFEKHFMLHYLTNEIGFETMGLFKIKLQSKLWDIMPTYDELYKTMHLDLNLFDDVHITTTTDSENESNTESTSDSRNTSTSESESKTVNGGATLALSSDTPQQTLDIHTNDYVSSIQKNIDDTNSKTNATASDESVNSSNGSSDTNAIGHSVTTTHGNNGNNAEKLEKYRRLILNIERDIIRDCRDLFMLIY